MTIGGLVLGLVPGLSRGARARAPELVFLLFLPPILFAAAFLTSPRELRANARPIGLLAVGLVLVDDGGGRLRGPHPGARNRAGRPPSRWAPSSRRPTRWPPPPSRSGWACPAASSTILEGESLVNDATALVALRLAIVAAVTGAFSLVEAAVRLRCASASAASPSGWWSAGSIGPGRGALSDPPVEILVSLLAPFAAWIAGRAARGLGRAGGGDGRDRARPRGASDPQLRYARAGLRACGRWWSSRSTGWSSS